LHDVLFSWPTKLSCPSLASTSSHRPHDPGALTLSPRAYQPLTDFCRLHLGRGRRLGFMDLTSLTLVTSHWHPSPVTFPHRLAFFLDFTWPALLTQATGRHQFSMHTGQDRCQLLGIYLPSIFHGNSNTVASEAGGGYACRIAAISLTSASLDPIFSSWALPGVSIKALASFPCLSYVPKQASDDESRQEHTVYSWHAVYRTPNRRGNLSDVWFQSWREQHHPALWLGSS
jgi:hypothetical protein